MRSTVDCEFFDTTCGFLTDQTKMQREVSAEQDFPARFTSLILREYKSPAVQRRRDLYDAKHES